MSKIGLTEKEILKKNWYKITNRSEKLAYLHWPPSVEWRDPEKCGGNSVNLRTRQRTYQGLHAVHTLRKNIPDTLPKTYQPREQSILPNMVNKISTWKYQGYLGALKMRFFHPQELPTCDQEANHCGSFAWISWGEKQPEESIHRWLVPWIDGIYNGTVWKYHQTNQGAYKIGIQRGLISQLANGVSCKKMWQLVSRDGHFLPF